ncbi:hypothetical protein PanWU01x14_072360 [Parasponia andersonii]|uniref:Uncharacterized protein n=1 Tax=Parasponia andersonii TaxID=3476 RepID=A0A2P5DDT8_PARAD|nr:hypothetical protein PanWU01x14_072360 [Parasponia andersonii]
MDTIPSWPQTQMYRRTRGDHHSRYRDTVIQSLAFWAIHIKWVYSAATQSLPRLSGPLTCLSWLFGPSTSVGSIGPVVRAFLLFLGCRHLVGLLGCLFRASFSFGAVYRAYWVGASTIDVTIDGERIHGPGGKRKGEESEGLRKKGKEVIRS